MAIHASAPNKIHIAGEHSVVYGGLALIAPVELEGRRNSVELSVSESSEEEFVFSGDLGRFAIRPDGSQGGAEIYFPMAQCVRAVFEKTGFSLRGSGRKFECVLHYGGAPKGTGNSASIPAALAAALYRQLGVTPGEDDIFNAAYAVDNIYHGGKSSGGDVRAVISAGPLLFRKVFANGTASFEYRNVGLRPPEGTELLLADSYKSGPLANTAEQISTFARRHGIAKPPAELPETERKTVTAPFDAIVEKMEKEFAAGGNPAELGRLFDQNHRLLAESGVSSECIEECVSISRQNGALGAKLIGAGGNGGAVLALCEKKGIPKIRKALAERKFAAYPVTFSQRGASVD
ncbi:hypothetical protein HY095_03985 [Candidatus Micrarchaeota archaeon]|nr:hypothetical protein [Candidatus Micrarchaeota archaeon]